MVIPTRPFNIYQSLTEEGKKEVKRTGAGIASQVVREGIELSRLLTDPSQEEIFKTEDFLEQLYSGIVGKENVIRTQRGDKEVVTIAEPESTAGQITRDIGSFAVSMAGLGKITKPLQALNVVQKVKTVAPKTVATAGLVARGETAAQLSLNPYEENLANVLGDMIDDNQVGVLSNLEKYMLEPIKSSQEKTELQNRVGLLAEGLLLTGAFQFAEGAIRNRDQIKKSLITALDSIKEKGPEYANAFINKTKRLKQQDNYLKEKSISARKKSILEQTKRQLADQSDLDMGDINSLSGLGLDRYKLSTVNIVRNTANALGKTFSSRGGRTKQLHEKFLNTKFTKEKWDSTIDHTGRNLEKAIEDIYKAVGRNKDDVIDNINKILFTDYRVPGIITSKGSKAPIRQQEQFLKKIQIFPKEARGPILKARELQDRLSKLLLDIEDVPIADKEIIRDQLGFYVRESYKLFEDAHYTPTVSATNEARKFVKKEILKNNPNINKADLQLTVQAEMDKLAGGKGQFANLAKGFESFSQIRTGLLETKKEIPQPIKNYLGEVTNPTDKLLISMKKISQFVEDTKFHNQAYKDGKNIYFYNKNNIPGFTEQIPFIKDAKVQPYGVLSGKYTTPQLAEYYTTRYEQGLSSFIPEKGVVGNIWRSLLFLKSQAQKSATTRRFTTHLKNIFGGAQITAANGFTLLNPKTFQESLRSVSDQLTRSTNPERQKLIEEFSGQGVLNKNAVINDLKNLSREASEINFIRNIFDKPVEYLRRLPVIKKIPEFDEKVTELYIAEDDMWKINMYKQEKKYLSSFNKSLPEGSQFNKFRLSTDQAVQNEAGRLTRNGLPNYDLVPEYFKELRAVPVIGTFFSFLSESVRLAYRIPVQGFTELSEARTLQSLGATEASKLKAKRGLDRLTGFGVAGMGGGYAATSVANYAYGVGEDLIEDLKPFLPEWMQNDNVVYTVNEEGVPIVYNITPWDAFDFPRKPFQTALHIALNQDLTEEQQEKYWLDLVDEIFTPFFGESLTQETITAYINNGRTIDGKILKNPFDSSQRYDQELGRRDGDNFEIVLANLFETLIPGTLTDTGKYLGTKLGQDKTEFGQDIYQTDALIKWVTGFGGMPLNKEYIENIYEFKISDFKKRQSSLRSELYDSIKSDIGPDKFEQNWLDTNQKYYKAYKELHTISHAADRLGIPTLSKLSQGGISRRDIFSFLPNNYFFTPLILTETMKEKILETPNLQNEAYALFIRLDELEKTLSSLPVLIDEEKSRTPLQESEAEEFFETVRTQKVIGGLIEGSEDVPYTKEEPEERINPFTGEPYTSIYETPRLGFAKGDEVKLSKKEYQELFNEPSKVEPKEATESFKDIIQGFTDGLNDISKGISKTFKDSKSLTEEQILNLQRLKKNEGGRVSREKEYKEKLQDLEEFISKNRLVSKEAQMNQMMGEGYRDPRFIATTGNELIDRYGLRPLAPEGSGQVLYDKQMGLQVSSNKNASVIDTGTSVSAETLGTYSPSSDKLKYQSMTYDLGRTDSTPEETQVHEIIHRADERSGYKEQREKRLKEKLPKDLKKYGKNFFSPLTEEILAHGLQHKLAGGNFNDKKLTDQVKFRIGRYASRFKNPKQVEKQLLQAMPIIVEDFESYLKEIDAQ